jgi:hypothetical protein
MADRNNPPSDQTRRAPSGDEDGVIAASEQPTKESDGKPQLTDPSLEAEFDAWEAASDEDLRRFEEELE